MLGKQIMRLDEVVDRDEALRRAKADIMRQYGPKKEKPQKRASSLDEILDPEDIAELEQAVMNDESTEDHYRTFALKARDKGFNSQLNSGLWHKFVHNIKIKQFPDRYKTPDMSGAWGDDYVKDRRERLEKRRKLGLDPYTGD